MLILLGVETIAWHLYKAAAACLFSHKTFTSSGNLAGTIADVPWPHVDAYTIQPCHCDSRILWSSFNLPIIGHKVDRKNLIRAKPQEYNCSARKNGWIRR